jgi:hypothetical protein
MAYVLESELTPEYVNSLIERNGYTLLNTPDISDQFALWQIQDLDGHVTNSYGLPGTRNFLIQRYVIMQNG